jgi:hypothetical protein
VHGRWGADARIRSGFVRRREAAGDAWRAETQDMFTYPEGDQITESDMAEVLAGYDKVLAALVEDVELLAPRQRYAPITEVTLNAVEGQSRARIIDERYIAESTAMLASRIQSLARDERWAGVQRRLIDTEMSHQ